MKFKISLMDLIEEIDGSVVLKISDTFPDYEVGSDVDLLVLDCQNAVRMICRFFEDRFEDGEELRVSDTPGHCHVDFLFNGKLEIRIDLIDDFDFYAKFSVKNGFVAKIFKDCQVRHYGNQAYYIPAEEDNLTIRYFEYLEYFDKRPDKAKHLEFICAVEDEAIKHRFFDNTHRYIRFERKEWVPRFNDPHAPNSRRDALRLVGKNLRFLVVSTIQIWLKKIVKILQ